MPRPTTRQLLGRQLRRAAKRGAVTANRSLSRAGVLVSPRHYYSPAPDLRGLAATREQWERPSQLPGLDIDLDAQMAWLASLCEPYREEYRGNEVYLRSAESGPGYGHVEAQALHGVLRGTRPRRYLEVGSGVSTKLALHALALNEREGSTGAVTCVEPHPRPWLREHPRVTLHRTPVQAADLSLFTSLAAGDVLFVDSSHVVKPGSDVNFLVLEVFPRLAPGVLVHVHDICLPYDYQRDLFDTVFHWSETSLVRAYLTHNSRARISACMSHLHYTRPDDLAELFPGYRPQPGTFGLRAGQAAEGHFPSSLWFVTR
ncbi:class I SAM-dependent methyltransferase [Streptomyces boninensis]|uniref:class I SAM-dependent methyltransferase n=1 Tax=Streptomyces boninensis TaxID=2039455 RepID=UPI003B220647